MCSGRCSSGGSCRCLRFGSPLTNWRLGNRKNLRLWEFEQDHILIIISQRAAVNSSTQSQDVFPQNQTHNIGAEAAWTTLKRLSTSNSILISDIQDYFGFQAANWSAGCQVPSICTSLRTNIYSIRTTSSRMMRSLLPMIVVFLWCMWTFFYLYKYNFYINKKLVNLADT